jgi:hypothetical protein
MRRGGMRDRAIAEFGKFISMMRGYLTWKEKSSKDHTREMNEFMELIPVDMFDTTVMLHYYILYDLYDTYYTHEIDNFNTLLQQHKEKVGEYGE